MSSAPWGAVLAAGAAVGVLVGLVGTSGAFMIPVLVMVFGLSQMRAQGTALFIALLPVWFFPMLPYWRAGNVDWKMGLLLGTGLAAGGYFGAQWAQHLPVSVVRKLFAAMLAIVSVRMFLQR